MKKILFLTLCTAVAACDGGNKDDGEPKGDPCEGSDQRCVGDVLEECQEGHYAGIQDCAETNQICEEDSGGSAAAECVDPAPPSEEGEPCDTAEDCVEGLDCVNDTCARSCDPTGDGSECDGDVCVEVAAGVGICFPAAVTGEICIFPEQCTGEGEDCQYMAAETVQGQQFYYGACLQECDPLDVNEGPGTCSDPSFVCLPNPGFVNVQQSGTPPDNVDVTCDSDEDCDDVQGYACWTLGDGNKYCSRYLGICGEQLPMFGSQTAVPEDISDVACGPLLETGNTKFCGLDTAGDDKADTACVQLTQDGFGVCIGFCGDDAGGPDKDCGVGYGCAAPATAEDAFYFDIEQEKEAGPIVCDLSAADPDAGCDTEEDFACAQLPDGQFCARGVSCDPEAGTPDAPCDSAVGNYHCVSLQSGDWCSRPAKQCTPL